MINPETFAKNSPFKLTHSDTDYNLTNTTPDLLKFQLQEQYRSRLDDISSSNQNSDNLNLLSSQLLRDSFTNHLQSNLDEGNIGLNNDSIPSLSSTSTSEEDEFEIDTFILNKSNKPNYLNLKILIENSIFDTNKIKKDSILSLSSLKRLKALIQEKKDFKQYLLSKVSISQQFISNIILNPEHTEMLDASLLLKILKSNNYLHQQLLLTNNELDELTTRLNNHNLACLVLGYVEDVKLTSNVNNLDGLPLTSPNKNGSQTSTQRLQSISNLITKSFDTLFSRIASIAAQRNITLPSPPSPSSSNSESIESRTKWAQNCIDAILAAQPVPQQSLLQNPQTPIYDNSMTNMTIPSTSGNTPSKAETIQENSILNDSSFLSNSPFKAGNDRIIAEYKTALNDLRFSHQYLAKEYEYSRESSLKAIQEYRKKNSLLEKEISKLKESFNGYDSMIAKEKEIAKLRRDLNLLKIDKLGIKNSSGSFITSPRLLQTNPSPTSSNHNFSSISPITGESLIILDTIDNSNSNDDDHSDIHSISSVLSSTQSASINSGLSNGILRKEFKKIVGDIQDRYEIELREERIRRRKLQDEVDQLKSQLK